MLALFATLGTAHATPCEDWAPSPYDEAICERDDDFHNEYCVTTNGGDIGFRLECKVNDEVAEEDQTDTSITAVYMDADDTYIIYGKSNEGDEFCCDNETISPNYGDWDGVASDFYGFDDEDHSDVIDLTSWTGDAWVHTYGGNDLIYGVDESGSRDHIYGGDGDDQIDGMAGDDTLYGEVGDDTLCGGTEEDYLYGGAGGDILFGGDAHDFMYGGKGAPPYNRCEPAGVRANTLFLCNDGPRPFASPVRACPKFSLP